MRKMMIVAAAQLQPGDVIQGDQPGNQPPNLHRCDQIHTRVTQLVNGRVSLLVTRPTSKRPVRVLYNPATMVLITREEL